MGTIGLGRNSVSSRSRVPRPPHRMTTFMFARAFSPPNCRGQALLQAKPGPERKTGWYPSTLPTGARLSSAAAAPTAQAGRGSGPIPCARAAAEDSRAPALSRRLRAVAVSRCTRRDLLATAGRAGSPLHAGPGLWAYGGRGQRTARPTRRKSSSTAALACRPLADWSTMAWLPRAARIEATRSKPAGILATPMM